MMMPMLIRVLAPATGIMITLWLEIPGYPKAALEKQTGKVFGDAHNPLLV